MKRNTLSILLLLGLGLIVKAEPQAWMSSETRSFDCGETIIIHAIANNGYEFTRWEDGDTNNPRTIELTNDAPTSYKAIFSVATAVDEVQSTLPKARKVLIDDKLFIILDNQLYDVTGKRVK